MSNESLLDDAQWIHDEVIPLLESWTVPPLDELDENPNMKGESRNSEEIDQMQEQLKATYEQLESQLISEGVVNEANLDTNEYIDALRISESEVQIALNNILSESLFTVEYDEAVESARYIASECIKHSTVQ